MQVRSPYHGLSVAISTQLSLGAVFSSRVRYHGTSEKDGVWPGTVHCPSRGRLRGLSLL